MFRYLNNHPQVTIIGADFWPTAIDRFKYRKKRIFYKLAADDYCNINYNYVISIIYIDCHGRRRCT